MRIHLSDAWVEAEHPRGQPKNAGEFAKGSGGKKSKAKTSEPKEFDLSSWLKEVVGPDDVPQVAKAAKQIEHAAKAGHNVNVVVPKALAQSIMQPTRQEAASAKRVTNPAHRLNMQVMGIGNNRERLQAALQKGVFPGLDKVQNLTVTNVIKPISTAGAQAAMALNLHQATAITQTTRQGDKSSTAIKITDATRHPELLVSVMTHELGHAVDDNSYNALSNHMAEFIGQDFAKLSPEEQQRARYYRQNNREGFAELYRLAFSPERKGAYHLPQKKAESIFATSLAELRKVLNG